MAEQCYRGLEGHPTELKRIRDVASKLSAVPGEAGDKYKEEIGYSAEELAEVKNTYAKSGAEFLGGSPGEPMHQPGMPPEGPTTKMIEAGVTSNNSPNPSMSEKPRRGY